MGEIKGLPIFAAGKWHGKDYTASDLDEMVNSYNATVGDFVRPIGLTHDDPEQNKFRAALGTIRRIYRAGSKLLADVQDVPDKLNQAIKERRILGGSVTLYPEYKGKKNVLRSFDFLGRDIPEVKGLGDLRSYAFSDSEPEFETIEFKAADKSDGDDNNATGEPGGEKLTDNNKTKGSNMDPIKFTDDKGVVHEFADGAALQSFITTQINTAKEGLVPESELQRFKEAAEQAARKEHEATIKTMFAEFRKPKDGKVIPPAVVDGVESLAMALPFGEAVIQFKEGDKDIDAVSKLKQILEGFRDTGLINFKENGESDPDAPKTKTLKQEFTEFKKAGYIRADMTFEEFQEAQG